MQFRNILSSNHASSSVASHVIQPDRDYLWEGEGDENMYEDIVAST